MCRNIISSVFSNIFKITMLRDYSPGQPAFARRNFYHSWDVGEGKGEIDEKLTRFRDVVLGI
jgi:hypothetical protein